MLETNSAMPSGEMTAGTDTAACPQCGKQEPGAKAICWTQRILAWVLSAVLLLVGIYACALAIHISIRYPSENPILLTQPEAAIQQVTDMMEAVCDGDYEKAGTFLLGTPSLGAAEPPESDLGVLLWDAFLDSTSFNLVGDCYTTEVGLAQSISFTYMDPASVTANLRERSQELLNQRVEAAEDVSEIYDENNEYREAVVMEVLYEAAQAALLEDAKMVTVSLTVNLKYQDGTWWVVADDPLLDAFSGGMWR